MFPEPVPVDDEMPPFAPRSPRGRACETEVLRRRIDGEARVRAYAKFMEALSLAIDAGGEVATESHKGPARWRVPGDWSGGRRPNGNS